MVQPVRTIVTFKNSAFNTSVPKEYFINDCCFGDDVAKWLAEELRRKGHQADETPGQEDFGWYFNFEVSGFNHCFVIGLQSGDTEAENTWIGWVERRRGFGTSLFGGRDRDIHPDACLTIHKALLASPETHSLRWHFKRDFDSDAWDPGTPTPSFTNQS